MTTLSAAATDLLSRWHPEGLARLSGTGSERQVAVRGPHGAGSGVVAEELGTVPGFEHSEAAADVVICVVDAAAPITDTELDEVKALASRGQSLVVAVNKIDVHPDWTESLSATAALVGPIDASIPVLGVSALLAQLSRQTGCADAHSGFAGLRAEVERAKPLAGDRALAVVVAEAVGRLENEIEHLNAAESALRAQRIDLLGQRDGGRATALAAAKAKMQLARVGLLHDVTDAVRGASQRLRARIERAGVKDLRSSEGLGQQTAVELIDEVSRRSHERLSVLGAADLELDGVRMPEPPQRRSRTAEDSLMVVLGASAGFGIGRLAVAPLSLVPAADIATMPAALGLGGAVAWWFVRMRSLGADRAHVRTWANDALASMKSQIEQIVHARLVESETALASDAMASSMRNAVAIDQELARIESEIRRQAPETAARRARLATDLAGLRSLGLG